MKKSILIVLLTVAVCSNTKAQLVKFGLKAGINYANQTGTAITVNNTNYNTDAITSYHAGIVAEIHLLKQLSLQPELIYSTQGATYKNVVEEFKNELGYISIPILLKINLNSVFSLDLGPQASFLLSEKNNFTTDDASTFEFATVGGLGIKLSKSIFLQGRYVLGLSTASKDAEIKNSVLQISAGINF